MPTRREILQSAAALTATTLIPKLPTMPKPAIEKYNQDKPLLQLQQEFLDLRFGMFLHFNMATFQDREWGDPTGAPSTFNPTALDTDQWLAAAQSAHMQYACLTTKHHDGFPIWATKTKVDHSSVDVVAEFVESCHNLYIKPCLYYSILDLRNDIRHFNITPEKVQLIKDQLTELLTNYGKITMLIFDGWDAPWSRIPYTEIPFHEIYALVKELQPNCVISELNASQYPPSALYYSDIKAFEQNAGQNPPTESSIPAQSCVTLTDGWFWKSGDENRPLKPTKTIVEEWLIPQNAAHCNLLLNAAPNREGKLAPNIVERLREIGEAWLHPGSAPEIGPNVVITTDNLTTGRPILASTSPDTVGPDQANDGNFTSTWYLPEDQKSGWLEVDLGGKEVNTLILAEPIGKWKDYDKNRIKSFKWQSLERGSWVTIAEGNNPNHVQINQIPRTKITKLRLTIEPNSPTPHISEIGAYNEPT